MGDYDQRLRTTVWCFRIADLFENSVYDGQPGINCLSFEGPIEGRYRVNLSKLCTVDTLWIEEHIPSDLYTSDD